MNLYVGTSVCTQDRCQFVLPDDLRVRLLGSVADGSITLKVESGAKAQGMLAWRHQHLDRTLTGLLVQDGGVGRWPDGAQAG